MKSRYSYQEALHLLINILIDIEVLASERTGRKAWQQTAEVLATNMELYAAKLRAAAEGSVINGPVLFPGLNDLIK